MDTLVILLCNCICISLVILPVNCNTCPANCPTCSNTDGKTVCTSCNDGYWLYQSSCQPCPDNCATCSNASSCGTCKSGLYSPQSVCISPCSTDCVDGLCDEQTGVCNACPSNRYGYYCTFNCSLCKDETCELRRCTDGCKSGYWQHQDGYVFDCRTCMDDCASCDNWSVCDKCNDGFYISEFSGQKNYCKSCRVGCVTCSSNNACSACKAGYYGAACEHQCLIHGCYQCDSDGGSTIACYQCANGFVLQDNKCVVAPSQQCLNNCKSCTEYNVCEKCKAGWYGALCDKPCNSTPHCVACQEKDSSIICNECDVGYVLLDGECSVPSATSTTLPAASSKSSPTLNTFAPTSKTTKTTQTSTYAEQMNSPKQTDNNLIMIGAIAGGVCFLLLVVVIVTTFLIKRRKTNARNNQHGESADEQRMEDDLALYTADYPVYAKPNKATKAPPTEEYIYAQPNKLKKSNQQTSDAKKDSQGPSSDNNVAISLDMETDMAETDVDEIQLETLEGELTSEIETGVDVPSSDTYYNVEGLLRSRVEVSNLLEYVKKKHDFDSEFQKLPKGLIRSCNEALRVHNRKKNRFNGIYAYDATRVVLGSKSYINANHIDGHNQTNAYIASLGPTSDTMNKFSTLWEMVWQEGVEVIVMLTNLEEREKMKCEQYWPNPGTTKTCHDYIVHCTAENVFAEFAVRELTLERTGVSERRSLRQYHYTAWPDRYVPDTVASLVEFRDKVEEINRRTKSPIVVHCSAGIGRTGTYIALDLLINEGRDCNYVDMFGCALGLRGQRVNLIQNEEQYEYLHHAVLYSLSCYTEPIVRASFHNLMSEERIAAQFKALKVLPVPSKRLSLWTLNYMDRKENRSGADIPRDSHRVRLLSTNRDYINAVYVNGYQRKNAYIAAQTPMPSTVEDFLSMVFAERCPCIIDLDEENPTLKSVAQYLPEVSETSMFGQYQIHCKDINTFDDYIIRDVVVFRTPSDKLELQHYQFRKWKVGDIVPSSTDAFLNLVTKVGSTVNDQHGPVLLHCLTGSQRCGVFCAVSTMVEKLAIDRHLSGIHTFCHIRNRRSTALQKQEMFKFCYHCVADYINLSSNRDNYYNVLVPNGGQ